MEAFLESLLVVAVAEIGDRTQILSLLLASRFRRPVPILCGILVATVANHALAALAGEIVGEVLRGEVLRWLLAVSFLAMAVWVLIPDKLDDNAAGIVQSRGAFLATVGSFFIAEIGDKTEIATAALAARFDLLLPVVLGSTAGMMIANVPAVLAGHLMTGKLNPRYTRYVAAALLAAQGALAALGVRMI
jgi:putative Ca2+/H+ antiporter (TMEM165/GDT1 family)